MTKITYETLQHDGRWAYRVDETYSESFSTHDRARAAAERAAREQLVSGRTAGIVYEDKGGRWHKEISAGGDRPATLVKG